MDQEKIKLTMRRMIAARALLISENPFFGHLAMGLTLACGTCGTACTDGSRLIFDPDFAELLSDRELQFVILHEVLHCVLGHCFRGANLDSFIHNIACDIVVNSTILEMWGLSTYSIAGQEPMHRIPDGREGRLFNAEEVYHMLLRKSGSIPTQSGGIFDPDSSDGSTSDDSAAFPGGLDRHDVWKGAADDKALKDSWNANIMEAANYSSSSSMPQAIRNLIDKLTHKSKLNWRQLLHDLIQTDICDYSFLPPDRRYTECDFFFPAFNPDDQQDEAENIWVCVDTSGSITDDTLTIAIQEILDAMRQVGLHGSLSFFDDSITVPVPFSSEADIRKIEPVGYGGTSFDVIFEYMQNHMRNELPKAVIVFTDGFANIPAETESMQVPVLWLISKDGNTSIPWGTVIEFE